MAKRTSIWILAVLTACLTGLASASKAADPRNPRNFSQGGPTLYFKGSDSTHGAELWTSDGTRDGTYMIEDINPEGSSSPALFTFVGNTAFFIANDGTHGFELWKTDGTTDGTVMVKDINPRQGKRAARPESLVAVGNMLFFAASDGPPDAGGHGKELWKSDGTEEGTVLVKDINPSTQRTVHSLISWGVEFQGELFFAARDGEHGKELWRSDGTEEGTVMIEDIMTDGDQGSNPEFLVVFKDQLFFSHSWHTGDQGIWRSDGTAEGTVLVKRIRHPDNLIVAGNKLYFNELNIYLWATDGTTDGTKRIKRFDSDSTWDDGIHDGDSAVAALGNNLLFIGNEADQGGRELWRSDGTTRGTVLVKNISPNGDAFPKCCEPDFTVVQDEMFFIARDRNHGFELWKTDGTGRGTTLVRDIRRGPKRAFNRPFWPQLASFDGKVFFNASDDGQGRELWKSDGSRAGTRPVTD